MWSGILRLWLYNLSLCAPFCQGLTPCLFWEHRQRLLDSSRDSLESEIRTLIAEAPRSHGTGDSACGIRAVHSRVCLGTSTSLPFPSSHAVVVITDSDESVASLRTGVDSNILILEATGGKRGQIEFLETILPRSLDFVSSQLAEGHNVAIVCRDGKDMSVGVAIAALQIMFDGDGSYVEQSRRSEYQTGLHISSGALGVTDYRKHAQASRRNQFEKDSSGYKKVVHAPTHRVPQ